MPVKCVRIEMDLKGKEDVEVNRAENGESSNAEQSGRAGESSEQQIVSQPNDDVCPICCQQYTFKTELPECGHKFCFLCIKGVALRNGTCPLCRKLIPRGIFRDPVIMTSNNQVTNPGQVVVEADTNVTEDVLDQKQNGEVHWFYEARHGGWWRYERRHEVEIEEAYQCGARSIDMLIAGSLYSVDLENMRQYRKNRNSLGRYSRAIKRVEEDVNLDGAVRGVAGLRTPTEQTTNTEQSNVPGDLNAITVKIGAVDLTQQ